MNSVTTTSGQQTAQARIPVTAGWARKILLNSLSRLDMAVYW